MIFLSCTEEEIGRPKHEIPALYVEDYQNIPLFQLSV